MYEPLTTEIGQDKILYEQLFRMDAIGLHLGFDLQSDCW